MPRALIELPRLVPIHRQFVGNGDFETTPERHYAVLAVAAIARVLRSSGATRRPMLFRRPV
jgi:hypothetical protein